MVAQGWSTPHETWVPRHHGSIDVLPPACKLALVTKHLIVNTQKIKKEIMKIPIMEE